MSDEEKSIPKEFAAISEQMDASMTAEIQKAVDRPVTEQDIAYLLHHYPYLQILNDRADFAEQIEPQFVRSDSGWLIHDYVEALSSSPGEFLFSHADSFAAFAKDEDDDGGSGGVNPGKGTIINQAYITATQMVQIALERGWMVLRIVAGHPVMRWAAWMVADKAGVTVVGYEPSKKDYAKRERVHREGIALEKLRSQIRPKKG